MKKPILTLFAFICCLAVLANEPIEVVALMKAQYDRTLLGKQAGYYATRAERRTFVVNELKAFAEASQRDLRGTLDELEQEGLVSSIQSLLSLPLPTGLYLLRSIRNGQVKSQKIVIP